MNNKKIRIGIAGYGNLGRGTELAVMNCPDMELVGIFTRRDPSLLEILSPDVPKYRFNEAFEMKNKIDVMILCGGSATDLPVIGPQFAEHFNTIDSFDTHAKIADYFSAVDVASKKGGNVNIISVGWDPGLFSLNRMYAGAILRGGADYTFWGRGVSQGHSDAIRRIEGVIDAKQYTIPVESSIEAVRSGSQPVLTAREKHTRECYVVVAENADRARIEREIKEMPNYFSDYDTTVYFISLDELHANHSGMSHGGVVIRTGKTGKSGENNQKIEYSLMLDSNPEFTGCVLAAYARAVYRMKCDGMSGAKTVLDVPPAYLSDKTDEELRRQLL